MSTRERRSVIALLVADGCSAAAALGQETAIGKLVYDITHSKLDLGLLGLVEFAPAVVLVLATGAVADRWPRPKVAAAAMAAESVAAAGMAWYVHAQGRGASVPVVLAIVVAFGVARAFAAPAARALPADVVAADRLPWVMARSSLAFQAGIIAGPVLGGFLYAANTRSPYPVVAGLAVSGALLVLSVRRPAHPRAPLPEPANDVAPPDKGVPLIDLPKPVLASPQ